MGIKNFFESFVNADFYVAFVSLGLPLTVYSLYHIPFADFSPLVITVLLTFMIYAINRQVDQKADAVNLPQRTSFVKKYGKTLSLISLLGTLLAFFLSFNHSIPTGVVAVLAALVGYYYSYPIPFLGKRFKDHFVWKNVGVGLIYAFLGLISFVYFEVGSLVEISAVLFLFFSSWFLISSFFDLRDIEGDKDQGIRTIPIVVGKKKILSLFHLINSIPLFLMGFLTFFNMLPLSFVLLAFFTFCYTLIYLLGYAYKLNMKFLCMVVADATPLMASLFLILLQFFIDL